MRGAYHCCRLTAGGSGLCEAITREERGVVYVGSTGYRVSFSEAGERLGGTFRVTFPRGSTCRGFWGGSRGVYRGGEDV